MSIVDDLRSSFRGAENAYGVYIPDGSEPDEKGKIGGKIFTERNKPVTKELWEAHVKGKRGLGIVPIFDKNKCVWGCIDIDEYPPPIEPILQIVKERNYPLNLCYSKSGGLHIFLNMKEPVLASQMRSWLGSIASKLGLKPSVEIYPKQDRVGSDGVGNWIIMPFFGNSGLGIGHDKKSLNLSQYTIKLADNLEKTLTIVNSPLGSEAPPCLQRMVENGHVKPGMRNIFLANMVVLYRKEGRNYLEGELRTANSLFCLPQVGDDEIKRTVKSMTSKPYDYECHQLPYCDHATCIKREYGIGNGGGQLMFDTIIKYEEEGGKFEYEVRVRGEEKSMLLSEEEYANQTKFLNKFLTNYDRIPAKMSYVKWGENLNSRKDLVVFVPLEPGMRKSDRFKMFLTRYKDQHPIVDRNDIRNDKGGLCKDEHERLNFPKSHFREWLLTYFKEDIKPREIVAFLKEISGFNDVSSHLKIHNGTKHTTVLVYRIPITCFEENEDKDVDNEGEPL